MNGCDPTHGHRCAACADRADEAVVVSTHGSDATVRLDHGARARVAIDLVPGVRAGDRLLVHQGVAIAPLHEGGTE